MSPFLRFLLGLEEGEVPAGGESRWELSGLPHGGWLVISAAVISAAVVLIVLLYLKEKELGFLQRATLTVLRLMALVLVTLILLNPRILTEIHLTRPGKTMVVIDASMSMSQQDTFMDSGDAELADRMERATGLRLEDRPTRTQLLVAALSRQDVLPRLEERNRVALFTCGAELKPVAGIETEQDVLPEATESRLGDALSDALLQVGREPLAAVILFSDGRSNAGTPLLESARRLVLERRVPIYTVGVGKEHLPKYLAIRELAAPEVVEVGFPLEIAGKIAISGAREPVRAALFRHAEDGGGKRLVEERQIEPEGRLLETWLRFVDKLPRKGTFRYTLELEPHDEGVEFEDSRRDVYVSAVEEKRRLLLVAGNPSYEYRFLRNFLLRDDGIQASCWLSSADRECPQDGDVVIHGVPESPEGLREYDVVVLLDPDPESLSLPFQEALADFVAEQGGGVAYVCSEAHTPRIARESRFRRLRALLPIDLQSGTLRSPLFARSWRPQLTARGLQHPLCLLLDDPEENRELWSRLPALYFAYPARTLRPGAVGLLATPQGTPVAGLQRVGMGEVLYIGTDGLWRWRAASVALHERFWAGVVRYLALGKRQIGTQQVTVETDRDRYLEGDTVRITVQIVDGQRRPVEVPRLDAVVEGSASAAGVGGPNPSSSPSDTRETLSEKMRMLVNLAPVAGQPGRYEGLFRAEVSGHFEVQVEPDGESVFEVERRSSEMEDPSPDFLALEEVARLSGGRFLGLSELRALEEIPETSVTEVLGRRAATTWDSGVVMSLFCALMIIEWILRKLWRLV